jgi:hypothetical protein
MKFRFFWDVRPSNWEHGSTSQKTLNFHTSCLHLITLLISTHLSVSFLLYFRPKLRYFSCFLHALYISDLKFLVRIENKSLLRYEAFAATGFSTVLYCDQPRQMYKWNLRFEDHIFPHHQGYVTSSKRRFRLYIWCVWLPYKTLSKASFTCWNVYKVVTSAVRSPDGLRNSLCRKRKHCIGDMCYYLRLCNGHRSLKLIFQFLISWFLVLSIVCLIFFN